jgi:hypothetical protein
MTDDDVAKALSGLPREAPPPPSAETQTLAALRSAGLLAGRPRRWRSVIGAVLAIAASVLVGVWIGTQHGGRPSTPGQEKFLLLLYEDAGFQPPPAGARQERVAEYDAWAHALAQSGHLTVGEALSSEGTELRPGVPAAQLARAASGDGPDGFFVILAGDEASAVAIAKTCPHLHYGGRVRVWPILPD